MRRPGLADSRQVLRPDAPIFPRPDFFAGALLNFAENLLFPENVQVDEPSTAVITATEIDGQVRSTTWAQLREAVRRCSNALRAAGVRPSDVVAGFVSNHVEALVAMLAAATLGAIWTGISPDNGVSAVLDRLVQIEPKVLFADNGTVYNGKPWSSMDKAAQIVRALKTLQLVVMIENVREIGSQLQDLKATDSLTVVGYDDLLSR